MCLMSQSHKVTVTNGRTTGTVPLVRKVPNYLTYFHTLHPHEFANAAKM